MKGFDEPWQFIYRRYDHWYDTGTIGGATEEWVAIGIFSIFFTFALLGLIGTIISKIRRTGVKSLFVDFIKIPKTVYEYGKRSKKKVFDHFLAGVIISFIAGFFIKNPVAMPLFGITLLISFTMKQDSDKAFNHYTKECAKKMQDGEEKPLFADSALFCWGLGIGFLLYSYVGYTVWNDYDFCFRARLYETLIWTALALLIYVIRNGRKSTKVVARSLLMAFGAISGVMMCSFTAGATFLGHIYDKDGKIIGVRLILDNVCDGTPECSFGTALRNGMGGGLAGANAKANMAKRRKAARDAARDKGIPQMEEQTEKDWNEQSWYSKWKKADGLEAALNSAAKGNGDMENSETNFTRNEYLRELQNDISDFSTRMYNGNTSSTDAEEYNNLAERVNKYIRGDTDLSSVEKWNANPETAEQMNARIDNQAKKQAAYETAKEVAEGKTAAAMGVRTGLASLSGGSSEVYIRSMEAGINMYEGVNSGKYDTAGQAFVGETTNVVVEAGIDSITPGGGKIPSNNTAVQNLIKEGSDTVVGRTSEIIQESFTGGEDSFGEAASGWIADQMKKK